MRRFLAMKNLSRLFEELMILITFCEAGVYPGPLPKDPKAEAEA
jgi:hypothetical protein